MVIYYEKEKISEGIYKRCRITVEKFLERVYNKLKEM